MKLNCKFSIADSFRDFEKLILNEVPELLLLDLELDGTDAITVIKEIKSLNPVIPSFIIVCSPKADDFIQISALNSGADDFIDLPINPLLFESKLKALCKRLHKNLKAEKNESIYVDHERYKIIIGSEAHSLPRLEFKLIDLLVSHPNKIFSKDEIANEIWHNKDISAKRTIDIHIRNIRKELGEHIIKTYRGIGYSIKLSI